MATTSPATRGSPRSGPAQVRWLAGLRAAVCGCLRPSAPPRACVLLSSRGRGLESSSAYAKFSPTASPAVLRPRGRRCRRLQGVLGPRHLSCLTPHPVCARHCCSLQATRSRGATAPPATCSAGTTASSASRRCGRGLVLPITYSVALWMQRRPVCCSKHRNGGYQPSGELRTAPSALGLLAVQKMLLMLLVLQVVKKTLEEVEVKK